MVAWFFGVCIIHIYLLHAYIYYRYTCANVLEDKNHMIVGEMMINTHNMGNSFRCIPVQLNAVKSGHVFIFRKDTLRSTYGLGIRGSNVYFPLLLGPMALCFGHTQ